MACKNSNKTALLLGRFQPPHKGHEALILHLLKKHKKLAVAIGSSNKSRTKTNPLRAKERLFLLKKLFSKKRGKGGKISFMLLPDNPSNKKWAQTFGKKFPKEKYILYSANPLARALLKSHNFGKAPLLRRKGWQGKAIRKKIIEKKPYFSGIPAALRNWMKNSGEEIIRSCQN